MATIESPATVSKLPLLIMAAVVGLAVLVTIALVVARGPETYAPGSPEAALQDFLEAGFDGDSVAILELVTDESRDGCQSALDRERFDGSWYSDGLWAELEDMTVVGDVANAEVRFHQRGANDPFNNSRWSYDERFTIEWVDGAWLIDRAGWPWPFTECMKGQSS
jgi:hypothetical protein